MTTYANWKLTNSIIRGDLTKCNMVIFWCWIWKHSTYGLLAFHKNVFICIPKLFESDSTTCGICIGQSPNPRVTIWCIKFYLMLRIEQLIEYGSMHEYYQSPMPRVSVRVEKLQKWTHFIFLTSEGFPRREDYETCQLLQA